MVARELERIARAYERGVNEGDLEGILSLFAKDAVFYDPVGWMAEFRDFAVPQPDGVQPAFVGHEGLERFFVTVAQTFPDLRFRIERLFVSEDPPGVAFEWSGTSEKDGRTLQARAVDVFQIADGKITAVHGYIANPDTFDYH